MVETTIYSPEQTVFFEQIRSVLYNPHIVDAAISMFEAEFVGTETADKFSWGPLVVALQAVLVKYTDKRIDQATKSELYTQIFELFGESEEQDNLALLEVMSKISRQRALNLSKSFENYVGSSTD